MKLAFTLEYDGTNFSGFQRQKNALTVQEHLETAIEEITGTKLTINYFLARVTNFIKKELNLFQKLKILIKIKLFVLMKLIFIQIFLKIMDGIKLVKD